MISLIILPEDPSNPASLTPALLGSINSCRSIVNEVFMVSQSASENQLLNLSIDTKLVVVDECDHWHSRAISKVLPLLANVALGLMSSSVQEITPRVFEFAGMALPKQSVSQKNNSTDIVVTVPNYCKVDDNNTSTTTSELGLFGGQVRFSKSFHSGYLAGHGGGEVFFSSVTLMRNSLNSSSESAGVSILSLPELHQLVLSNRYIEERVLAGEGALVKEAAGKRGDPRGTAENEQVPLIFGPVGRETLPFLNHSIRTLEWA